MLSETALLSKRYRGGRKNSTPSASRRSLKILRGIFLKNVFRGWGSRREFWATRQGLNGPTGLIFHLLMCSSFHGIATTGSCKCFLYLHLLFGDFSFQLVQPVSSVGSFKPCLKVQISDAKHSEYHDQTQREEVARMAKAARSSEKVPKSRAALTPEAREKQLIALAIDVAEEQMRNGTASSQVISHFLKLGSTNCLRSRGILPRQRPKQSSPPPRWRICTSRRPRL